MEHVTSVFIADSAEEFCSGLSAVLQRSEGFQVVGTATDGEQAIRMIAERKPDVLVLDLMLSKQDGIAVLKAIAGMEHKPVTLATSAFVTDYYTEIEPGDTPEALHRLMPGEELSLDAFGDDLKLMSHRTLEDGTQEEIELSRERDRKSRLSNMDPDKRKIAESKRAYREANREKYNAYMRNYFAARRAKKKEMAL